MIWLSVTIQVGARTFRVKAWESALRDYASVVEVRPWIKKGPGSFFEKSLTAPVDLEMVGFSGDSGKLVELMLSRVGVGK